MTRLGPCMSGAVVELGACVGVPTPLNRAVCDMHTY